MSVSTDESYIDHLGVRRHGNPSTFRSRLEHVLSVGVVPRQSYTAKEFVFRPGMDGSNNVQVVTRAGGLLMGFFVNMLGGQSSRVESFLVRRPTMKETDMDQEKQANTTIIVLLSTTGRRGPTIEIYKGEETIFLQDGTQFTGDLRQYALDFGFVDAQIIDLARAVVIAYRSKFG
jgi:hypothetical protein